MWGDPVELWGRWAGSIGRYLHQNLADLDDRPWKEFCYWVTLAEAWEKAQVIDT